MKTSWPFIEWTEKVGEEDVEQLIVSEEVLLGDDVIRNMGSITKVEVFSCCFRPRVLSIKGDKVIGILAENKREEYFYHALFEDVHPKEKKALKVFVEGESTVRVMEEDGYYGNFAWNTKHIQRIIFPKGWTVQSAIPAGYILETFKGLPSIKWDREGKFRGDVQVKVIKA
jgi:hypothetical protein